MESTQEVLFCKAVPITIKKGGIALSVQSGGHRHQSSYGTSSKTIATSQENHPIPHSDHQDDSFYSNGKKSLGSEISNFTTTSPIRISPHPISEKKGQQITVQIVMASKSNTQMKVLEIQLTDENDPFFVYNLSITEEEFHGLKSQQSLLIDFLQFPAKFIELLESCISSFSETSPKFICTLTSENSSQFGLFSIVETNTFRNINHLSLQFVPGNDATVKQYLASLVKDFKLEIASLKHQLQTSQSSSTTRINEAQSHITKLTSELDNLRLTQSQQESHLKLERATEVSQLKESYAQEKETMRAKHDAELRSVTDRFEQEIKSLADKLSSLSVTHSSAMQHVQSLESALLAANKQNESNLRQIADLQKENERLTLLKHQVESECSEAKAGLTIMRDRLSELERRERETGDNGRQMQDRVLFLQEQKAKLEETVNLYKSQQNHQEDAIKKASDEINKANEIIRRLQAELKSSKSKLKLKNVVTLQQEKLLEEKQSNMDILQKEMDALKDSISKKNEEMNQLHKKVEELEAKVNESKGIIEDNNHVIEWLHKQLNEEALTRGGYASNVGGLAGYRPIDFDKYTSSNLEKRADSAGISYKPRIGGDYTTVSRRVASASGIPDINGRPPRSPTRLTTPGGKTSSPSRAHFQHDAQGLNSNSVVAGRVTSPSIQNAAMSNSYVATTTTHLPGQGTLNSAGGKGGIPVNTAPIKSSYF